MKETDERLGLPSASAWHRLELCPGSYQLSLKAEELGQVAHLSGPDAERGTRIHAWLAGEEVKLSEAELESAEFLLERASEQRSRIFGELKVEELKEKRLWLKLDNRLALSAKVDRVLYTPRLALLQNYKTGWSEPVEAQQNAQLKVEAVLVAVNLPTVTEVVAQIITGPFGVTEARYSLDDLLAAYNELVGTWTAVLAKDAPLNPSVEACRYCPAKLICKVVKEQDRALMLPLPEGGEAAARLLDQITVLRSRMEEIEEFYKNRLQADPSYNLPGYAMVPNAARREINDIAKAKSRLSEYLEESDLNRVSSFKLGELEKVIGKKIGLRGNELREKVNQILDGLIVEKIPSPSLKRTNGSSEMKLNFRSDKVGQAPV